MPTRRVLGWFLASDTSPLLERMPEACRSTLSAECRQPFRASGKVRSVTRSEPGGSWGRRPVCCAQRTLCPVCQPTMRAKWGGCRQSPTVQSPPGGALPPRNSIRIWCRVPLCGADEKKSPLAPAQPYARPNALGRVTIGTEVRCRQRNAVPIMGSFCLGD